MKEADQLPSLIGMDLEDTEALVKAHGIPKFRTAQLLEWLYDKNIESLDEASNLTVVFHH